MKIESKESTDFEPIEFTVTIESADELKELWWRMNINFDHIKEQQEISRSNVFRNMKKSNVNRPFWDFLNKAAVDRGLKQCP